MKNIPGLNDKYAATKDGRIWSHKRNKFLSPAKMPTGYLRVATREGDTKNYLVHRLIALTYIPNPKNKPEVHHLNAIRHDNSVENLQWATREENNQAAWDSGNKKFVWTKKFRDSVRINVRKAIKAIIKKGETTRAARLRFRK